MSWGAEDEARLQRIHEVLAALERQRERIDNLIARVKAQQCS